MIVTVPPPRASLGYGKRGREGVERRKVVISNKVKGHETGGNKNTRTFNLVPRVVIFRARIESGNVS